MIEQSKLEKEYTLGAQKDQPERTASGSIISTLGALVARQVSDKHKPEFPEDAYIAIKSKEKGTLQSFFCKAILGDIHLPESSKLYREAIIDASKIDQKYLISGEFFKAQLQIFLQLYATEQTQESYIALANIYHQLSPKDVSHYQNELFQCFVLSYLINILNDQPPDIDWQSAFNRNGDNAVVVNPAVGRIIDVFVILENLGFTFRAVKPFTIERIVNQFENILDRNIYSIPAVADYRNLIYYWKSSDNNVIARIDKIFGAPAHFNITQWFTYKGEFAIEKVSNVNLQTHEFKNFMEVLFKAFLQVKDKNCSLERKFVSLVEYLMSGILNEQIFVLNENSKCLKLSEIIKRFLINTKLASKCVSQDLDMEALDVEITKANATLESIISLSKDN